MYILASMIMSFDVLLFPIIELIWNKGFRQAQLKSCRGSIHYGRFVFRIVFIFC